MLVMEHTSVGAAVGGATGCVAGGIAGVIAGGVLDQMQVPSEVTTPIPSESRLLLKTR